MSHSDILRCERTDGQAERFIGHFRQCGCPVTEYIFKFYGYLTTWKNLT